MEKISIYSNKTYDFVNPSMAREIDSENVKEATVHIVPGFNSVPAWVVEDQMYKWAVADGDIKSFESAKDADKVIPFSGVKTVNLFKLCQENGIEVEPKQEREYYVEKLLAAGITGEEA